MAEKRSLFGMDSEDLADALESIYKRQKSVEEGIERIEATLLRMQTVVHVDPAAAGAVNDGGAEDGIPPLVKWALSQPWGTQLMHGLTDQDMISGLVKSGIEWLKTRAAAGPKVIE